MGVTTPYLFGSSKGGIPTPYLVWRWDVNTLCPHLFGSSTEEVGVTAPTVRMWGEVLRVKRDSSLIVRSRTLEIAVAAL